MLLGGVMPVETETFKGGAKTAIPDASSATASTLPPQGYNQKRSSTDDDDHYAQQGTVKI